MRRRTARIFSQRINDSNMLHPSTLFDGLGKASGLRLGLSEYRLPHQGGVKICHGVTYRVDDQQNVRKRQSRKGQRHGESRGARVHPHQQPSRRDPTSPPASAHAWTCRAGASDPKDWGRSCCSHSRLPRVGPCPSRAAQIRDMDATPTQEIGGAATSDWP